MATWVRKVLDISKHPRIKLNNIKDLPGAKKKVIMCRVRYSVRVTRCVSFGARATYTFDKLEHNRLLHRSVYCIYLVFCIVPTPWL